MEQQGNRVKKSIANETCQVVVIPGGDLTADAQGIFLAGRFASDRAEPLDAGVSMGIDARSAGRTLALGVRHMADGRACR
jgi:hypothetical protein